MGRERWYIALTGDCNLLKRAKEDPAFGEFLNWISIFEKGGQDDWPGHDNWPGAAMHREFCEAVKQMNVEHPSIATRVFTLDRIFDQLHYLLSEERRQGDGYADDWGTKAIIGATELPPHLKGTQGFSSRYSRPGDVAAIAAWMSPITKESLRSCYFPEDMDLYIYKFGYSRDDPDAAFLDIWKYFDDFRAFYKEVALHGEAILTIMD